MRNFKKTSTFTTTDYAANRAYFNEVRKKPVLSREEEAALCANYNPQVAQKRLVEGSLAFVISVAKAYSQQTIPLKDLINEGNKGLVEAAAKFDPTRGFRFISFAVWHIRRCILEHINTNRRVIALPPDIQQKAFKILKDSNCESEVQALGDGFEQELARARAASYSVIELDQPNMEGDYLELTGDIDVDTEQADAHNASLCQIAMSVLSAKERAVISCLFGIGRNKQNVTFTAETVGMTMESVRQIKNRALAKMKLKLKTENVEL